MAKYDYMTFKQLFDAHIQYSYEGQYGVNIQEPIINGGKMLIRFHKLYIFKSGELFYKTERYTYDPRLWPKIFAFAELLIETEAEKVLFAEKEKGPSAD